MFSATSNNNVPPIGAQAGQLGFGMANPPTFGSPTTLSNVGQSSLGQPVATNQTFPFSFGTSEQQSKGLFSMSNQSNVQSGFPGQNTGQPTGFMTAASAENTFGQSSGFGQAGFGQTPVFTGTTSFGQNPVQPLFGSTTQTSSSGASGGFPFGSGSGGATQSSNFSNTGPVFPVKSTKQDNVFKGSSASTSSVFGGQPKTTSVFGGTGVGVDSGSVFGGTSTWPSSATFPVHSTKQGEVFGSSASSVPVFSGQTKPASGFGGQSSGSGALFGGSVTTVASSSIFSGGIVTSAKNTTQSTNLFGGHTSTSNLGSNFAGSSKPSASTSNVFVSSASGSIFGGKSSGTIVNSKPLKIDVATTSSNKNTDIFKTLSPPSTKFITSTSQTQPVSFHSGTTDSSSGGALFSGTSTGSVQPGAFGTGDTFEQKSSYEDDGETSSNPFGDPKKRVTIAKSEASTNPFGDPKKRLTKGSALGLFGKPIKTEPKERGLFGKGATVVTKKEGRKLSVDTEDVPKAKKTPLKHSSSVSEDRVSLVCKNIPPKCNNALFLKKHFGKYGEITRTYPNQTKGYAIIHFKTHEQAAKAKRHGTYIRRDLKPMDIFWSKYSTSVKSPPVEREQSRAKSPVKRRIDEIKDENTKSPSKSSKWLKSDVEEELAGMSGTSDVAEEQIHTLSRPDELKQRKPFVSSRRQISPTRQTRKSSPVPVTTSLEDVESGGDAWKALMNSISLTVADRVQILKLRDRIIRQGIKKRSNLAMPTAFVGTCADMCPEKERYDREDKRRLHNFEILPEADNGGQNPRVDHSRAVKEYSRSSADQEEPLPHELRPLPVLRTTMTYLLTEIADKGGDGVWGDWFDFLWNRTRGIRKDLTQQQICEVGAAELLEKCVRFHIFCAERLCEEDMHSFDAKINNENMTKCLQTLKEIYHDLLVKHNTVCDNEAEMRGYMILMNLNQGDILRETQQLRADVRNSQLINFALEVYFALNSNNYVKFFRLVRVASFLNACIMHRYFTQIRSKALYTILKAHRKGEQYSVDVLVRILGFEDPLEASDFCQFYGLKADETTVILDRSALIEPEDSWLPRRAPNLIETKRSVSVGEVINGEKLPPFTLPEAYSSFDSSGKFIGKIDVKLSDLMSRGASPQPGSSSATTAALPVHKPVSQPVDTKPPAPQKLTFTNMEVKEIAKFMFWEVIDEFCSKAAKDTMDDVQVLKDISVDVCNDIVEDVISDNVQALSKVMWNEVQILRQKQQKAEKEAMMNRVAVSITSEIIKEVTDQEVLNLATAETREVKAELKRQQIARCSVDVADDVVNDAVADLVADVAAEVYQKDVTERLEQLAELEYCVQLQTAGRFFQYWKKAYVARLKLKRAMLTFPSAPSMASPAMQVDALIPDRRTDMAVEDSFFVNQEARLSIISPLESSARQWAIDKALSAHELYGKMCRCKAWQPLDMPKVIGQVLKRKIQRRMQGKLPSAIYWKLFLSLPDPEHCTSSHEQKAVNYLNSWLRSKFTRGSRSRTLSDVLSAYKAKLPTDGEESRGTDLCVCVRAAEGPVNVSDRAIVEALMGTSAILLVLPPGVIDKPNSEYWKSAKQRLNSILKAKPKNPRVSLVLMFPVLAVQSEFTNALGAESMLENYLDLDLVGDVYIMDVDYSKQLQKGFDLDSLTATEELTEAVQWLGSQYPKPPDLTVRYLRELVDDFLQKHFYTPVLYNLRQRKKSGYVHQKPSDLLTLYNDIVQHLCTVMSRDELQEQSWPVVEFRKSNLINGLPPSNWNDESHLEYVSKVISGLELPWLQDMDLEHADWSEICEEIWAYVIKVAGEVKGSARVDLFSKVRILLKKIHKEFEDTCYLLEGEKRCEPSSDNVWWTDLITACIDYRLLSTDFLHSQSKYDDDEELRVAYFESDLKGYKPPLGWRYLESDRDMTGMVSVNTTLRSAADKVRELRQETSLSKSKVRSDFEAISTTLDVPVTPLTHDELHQNKKPDLFELLAAEKRESQKFDLYLRNALKGSSASYDKENQNLLLPVNMSQSHFENAVGDFITTPSIGVYDPIKKTFQQRRHSSGRRLSFDENVSTSAEKDLESSVLEDSDEQLESMFASASEPTLATRIQNLQEEIDYMKRSNVIYEKRLKFYLEN